MGLCHSYKWTRMDDEWQHISWSSWWTFRRGNSNSPSLIWSDWLWSHRFQRCICHDWSHDGMLRVRRHAYWLDGACSWCDAQGYSARHSRTRHNRRRWRSLSSPLIVIWRWAVQSRENHSYHYQLKKGSKKALNIKKRPIWLARNEQTI